MFGDACMFVLGVIAILVGIGGVVGFVRLMRDDMRWTAKLCGGPGYRFANLVCNLVMLAMFAMTMIVGFTLLVEVLQ